MTAFFIADNLDPNHEPERRRRRKEAPRAAFPPIADLVAATGELLYRARMPLVPASLEANFLDSGWQRGRRVAVDSEVPVAHPAHDVLSELGGLRLMRFYGDYEVCEVAFQYLPEKDGPTLSWEAALGTELVGIAEHHNAHGELLISATGHVFGNSIVHFAFWHVGRTFQEAMTSLMLGNPGRPMLLETETSVVHFDREYMRADPEVLHPTSPELQ